MLSSSHNPSCCVPSSFVPCFPLSYDYGLDGILALRASPWSHTIMVYKIDMFLSRTCLRHYVSILARLTVADRR